MGKSMLSVKAAYQNRVSDTSPTAPHVFVAAIPDCDDIGVSVILSAKLACLESFPSEARSVGEHPRWGRYLRTDMAPTDECPITFTSIAYKDSDARSAAFTKLVEATQAEMFYLAVKGATEL